MTVVRRDARRRWLSVAAGVMVLCLLPSVIAFLRTPTLRVDPGELRERILASGDRPYQGYASTFGQIKLPEVPAIEDVAALFGTMRLRSWYAGPSKWRVAIMSTTGERDIYGTPEGTYAWDYEKNTTTLASGEPQLSLRPPNAADLVPPDLARRMLMAEPDVSADPGPPHRRRGRGRPADQPDRPDHDNRSGRHLGRPGHRPRPAGRGHAARVGPVGVHVPLPGLRPDRAGGGRAGAADTAGRRFRGDPGRCGGRGDQ